MTEKNLVLPYIVEDADRRKPFTRKMEIATIICLAEAKRRKKPGILGMPPERLSFVSKLYYPMWAVPWENECLIVDGLGIYSFNVAHKKPPDAGLFINHLKRSSAVWQLYQIALRTHRETFKRFIADAQFSFDGVIADRDLLLGLMEYVKEGAEKGIEEVSGNTAFIKPKIDETTASRTIKDINQHWTLIQSEIESLQSAVESLNEITKIHEEKLLKEIEDVKESYDKRLVELKAKVDSRVEKLTTQKNMEVAGIEKMSENELAEAVKEKKKCEDELRRLEQRESSFEKRKGMREKHGDETGASLWDQKMKECQNEISKFKARVQYLSSLADNLRKESEAATRKLREHFETRIGSEMKKITQLESLRDARISVKEEELEGLRTSTSTIVNAIELLIEQKQVEASRLRETRIPWKPEGVVLVYVPFYLIRYEANGKFKFYARSPAVAVSHEGIVRRIQKAIRGFSLESRINFLLRSRSKAFKKLLSSALLKRLKGDKALENTLYRLGSANSILSLAEFKETLSGGLEELKTEGWIKPEEKDAVLGVYALKTQTF